MKQFFKMFFASMLAVVVSGVILLIIFFAGIVGLVSKYTSENEATSSPVTTASVLSIDLSETLHEQGQKNSLASISGDPAFSAGLYEAVKAINAAAEDDNIKGILLKTNGHGNGWATSEQLRDALKNFKESDKFIYSYGETVPQSAYFIASVADSVFVNPVGDFEFKGFATQLMFFKNTLDKLKVQPEIFYAGKFKSATEPFRRADMSEENRLQVAELQHDFWTSYLNKISEHSHTDSATLNQLAQTGAIRFPGDAVAYKLADRAMYFDEVESVIRKKAGFDEDKDIKYVSLNEYAGHIADNDEGPKDKRIAVIFAEGNITDGEKSQEYEIASSDIIKTIREVRDNDKIKAVVLRVNSPGGSALASEVILRELQLLKEKKPYVVSMGDLAASGGYYIACQADSIFALPTTVTGSIGVFGMMFNLQGLFNDKLGITFDEEKNAPYADFPTAFRPLTADEAQRMQRGVDTIYSIFKNRVATGRNMNVANVDSIAQGRVWSGKTAVQLGLVDKLGDLNRAIESAASIAELDDYSVGTYPERTDKFEALMRKFKSTSASSAVAINEALKAELGDDYKLYKQMKDLRKMHGKVQMTLPFSFDIR